MNTSHLDNVSRETFAKLQSFVALVEKWSPKINLVSKASLPQLWERHVMDSVQLYDLAPAGGKWMDLGSGGGFPGIVIAILNDEIGNYDVTLVESDQRKCAFLRTALRELDVSAQIKTARIESLEPQGADIISARALADLSKLMDFAQLHLKSGGVGLFPKGENWKTEDEEAKKLWSYDIEAITSKTNPAAAVLKIKDIIRV